MSVTVDVQGPISSILICYPLNPPSLVDRLRAAFPSLHLDVVPQNSGNDYTSVDKPFPTEEQYHRAHVLLCFGLPKNLKSWDQTPNLKLLQLIGSGSSQVTNTEYYRSVPAESPLILANAAGIAVGQIAEHVLMTSMMLFHKMPLLSQISRNEQRWAHPEKDLGGLFIRELRGQTFGILGYGHIGREVARLARSFGARVIVCTRSGRPTAMGGFHHSSEAGDREGAIPEKWFSTAEPKDVEQFLGECDVVVNMLPSSDGNRHFVGRDALTAMKDDAIFINVGRGETVDQDALQAALENSLTAQGPTTGKSGTLRIFGAALDVTTPEPLPDGHRLWSLPNAIITPHCSFASMDNYKRGCDLLEINIKRINAGQGALNALRGRGEFDD